MSSTWLGLAREIVRIKRSVVVARDCPSQDHLSKTGHFRVKEKEIHSNSYYSPAIRGIPVTNFYRLGSISIVFILAGYSRVYSLAISASNWYYGLVYKKKDRLLRNYYLRHCHLNCRGGNWGLAEIFYSRVVLTSYPMCNYFCRFFFTDFHFY